MEIRFAITINDKQIEEHPELANLGKNIGTLIMNKLNSYTDDHWIDMKGENLKWSLEFYTEKETNRE
jgi:hypothetical protein